MSKRFNAAIGALRAAMVDECQNCPAATKQRIEEISTTELLEYVETVLSGYAAARETLKGVIKDSLSYTPSNLDNVKTLSALSLATTRIRNLMTERDHWINQYNEQNKAAHERSLLRLRVSRFVHALHQLEETIDG